MVCLDLNVSSKICLTSLLLYIPLWSVVILVDEAGMECEVMSNFHESSGSLTKPESGVMMAVSSNGCGKRRCCLMKCVVHGFFLQYETRVIKTI